MMMEDLIWTTYSKVEQTYPEYSSSVEPFIGEKHQVELHEEEGIYPKPHQLKKQTHNHGLLCRESLQIG